MGAKQVPQGEQLMLTKQEIFDRVWDHFVAQGKPQSRTDGQCMYRASGRADDPVRCAVGLLIPDNLYDDGMERQFAYLLCDVCEGDYGDIVKQFFEENFVPHKSYLADIQEAHDRWRAALDSRPFSEAMRDELGKIASNYGLTVPA